MTTSALDPRHAEAPLQDALRDSPVALIHGPRQSGKTTLAHMVCNPLGFEYVSFDEDDVRNAARSDPAGFVDMREIQRPRYSRAYKLDVAQGGVVGTASPVGEIERVIVQSIDGSNRTESSRASPAEHQHVLDVECWTSTRDFRAQLVKH